MKSSPLKRYGLALNRYKWPCLASCLTVVGIATLIARQPPPPPQYRAEGMLVQTVSIPDQGDPEETAQKQQARTFSENFLLSDRLLQRVTEELQTGVAPETTASTEHQGIAIIPETLRKHTDITVQGNPEEGQQVTVTFTWPHFDEAQAILAEMLETMVSLSLEDNQAQLATITAALEARLEEVKGTLQGLEAALMEDNRQEGLAIQVAEDGSLLQAISTAQEQQRQNEITLAALDSQIQSLQQQLGLTPDQALTASALSADPVIAQLRSQILDAETQLELLLPTLRESHPTMQDLKTNLAAYHTLLEERASEVIGGNGLVAFVNVSQIRQQSALDPARIDLANQLIAVHNERQALLQQQQVLAQFVNQLEQQYASLPDLQLKRARQVQEIELQRALYNQIQARYIDARTAQAETLSNLAIAEGPVTQVLPQKVLDPKLIMALGGILGILVAGAIARLLDILDGTLRAEEELKTILQDFKVPFFGTVSVPKPESAEDAPITPQNDAAYQGLRNDLKANQTAEVADSSQVILVTSLRKGEGKTTTAFNLGIASARAGHPTLIIEMDLHQASKGHLLQVSPAECTETGEPQHYYGLNAKDKIQPVPAIENLSFLPSPGPLNNVAEVIESKELKQFLVQCRDNYDFVILDAPELSIESKDSLAMGSSIDGMLLVTRRNYTKKSELEMRLEQLQQRTDAKLLGTIMNDFALAGNPGL